MHENISNKSSVRLLHVYTYSTETYNTRADLDTDNNPMNF
jgi:hypothetical protein